MSVLPTQCLCTACVPAACRGRKRAGVTRFELGSAGRIASALNSGIILPASPEMSLRTVVVSRQALVLLFCWINSFLTGKKRSCI